MQSVSGERNSGGVGHGRPATHTRRGTWPQLSAPRCHRASREGTTPQDAHPASTRAHCEIATLNNKRVSFLIRKYKGLILFINQNITGQPLSQRSIEPQLRQFELSLIAEWAYGIDFYYEYNSGQEIETLFAYYSFIQEQGMVKA